MTLSVMWKYIKPYLVFCILSAALMIGEVLMDLYQPDIMSTIVDDGVLGVNNGGVGDQSLILTMGLAMIGLVMFGGLCGALSNIFVQLSSQSIGNLMRKDCFRHIMNLSFQQTDRFHTGSLITRVTNDITQVQNLVAQFTRGLVRTTMLSLGSLFFMYRLNHTFALILLCTLPFIIGFMIFCMVRSTPMFVKLQSELDRINSILQEDISGIRVVKAAVREVYEKIRFGKANTDLVHTQLSVLVLFAFMQPVANTVMYIAVIVILWVGNIQVESGFASPGVIMAAITYTTQLLNGVLMLQMLFQNITRGMTSWRRIKEVLDCEPELKDGTVTADTQTMQISSDKEAAAASGAQPQNVAAAVGTPQAAADTALTDNVARRDGNGRNGNDTDAIIEFQNAGFTYPGTSRPVLHDINLKIYRGETLAILGATGCGKSTLIQLIPRFYDVTEGSVRVKGIDVRDYDQQALRSMISIAMQRSELFTKTVRENLSWGNPDASDEEIEKAADIAQATEFINTLPEGFDTLVAERGMSLSGGQKQRLSVARAILKDVPILIFDDATSALDLKTEANLYDALEQSRPDTTKIIVAQRVASARRADRILVLSGGTIVGLGTHNELMRDCDVYRDIYQSQLGNGGVNSYV